MIALRYGLGGGMSLSMQRRALDARYATRYFVGKGIDVGGGNDPLGLFIELFPLITEVMTYDKQNGDAQKLENIKDSSFDFLASSHCLEHLLDPYEGLHNWIRVVKPGGYLVITVPDEDLYEQGVWPSTFNPDHKHTFTIGKVTSWSPSSINMLDMLAEVCEQAQTLSLTRTDGAYRYKLPRFDQTGTPLSECAIEFILRKE